MYNSIEELWNAFEEFNYVVIRNYDNYLNSLFIDNHSDIDILCRNKSEIVNKLALKREGKLGDKVHFSCMVNDEVVYIDLRDINDGYFDQNWCINILKNRVLYSDKIFIMDNFNYFYTLLFHCIVHKGHINDEYRSKLLQVGHELNIIQDNKISDSVLIELLNVFLMENSYYVCEYDDFLLRFNLNNIQKSNIKIRFWFYIKIYLRCIIYKLQIF